MNSKILITAFLIGLAGVINSARANEHIPPVEIECHSINSDIPLKINGTFQERMNRHGAGQIDFTLSTPTLTLKKSGDAHALSADGISYSDNLMEVDFEDTNYYPDNVSRLSMNGEAVPMKCQFTSPESANSSCDRWECHHNTH